MQRQGPLRAADMQSTREGVAPVPAEAVVDGGPALRSPRLGVPPCMAGVPPVLSYDPGPLPQRLPGAVFGYTPVPPFCRLCAGLRLCPPALSAPATAAGPLISLPPQLPWCDMYVGAHPEWLLPGTLYGP